MPRRGTRWCRSSRRDTPGTCSGDPARRSSPPARSPEPAGWTPQPQATLVDLPRLQSQPVTGTSWSPPTEPARRPRGRARRAKAALAGTLALGLAAVFWVAGGSWSRAHYGIADRGAGIGGAVVANPAERSSVLARTPRSLQPRSAQAFDPYGRPDNDQLAPLAIDRSLTTAWQTDWYASPAFGNLQPGTGLMLDMGRLVTITGAQIFSEHPTAPLSSCAPGISAGSLADLPVLARETGQLAG